MPINAGWHGKHPMPKHPTLAQRIAWHLAHQKHCACRPIPEQLNQLIAARREKPFDPREHRSVALWAADCAEHVLRLFAEKYPNDNRPRDAIAAARAWARGEIACGKARAAALAAHAAARAAAEGPARAAARAAGHAAATAHVAGHARGSAMYAATAVEAASGAARAAIAKERAWQFRRLPEQLRSRSSLVPPVSVTAGKRPRPRRRRSRPPRAPRVGDVTSS